MNDKIVSIIVPIYNMEGKLERCFSSLLKQTYQVIEIILVDDGSTDQSNFICKKYEKMDHRIHFIEKANGGVSSARNAALDVASGDYVVFVDPDDYLEEMYIEKLLVAIEKSGSDIVECGAYVENDDGLRVGTFFPRFQMQTDEEILRSFCKNEGLTDFCWNKIYKKNLFDNLRFSELRCSEDFEILCKIFLLTKKVTTISDLLYHYVRTKQSVGNERFSTKKLDVILARENIIKLYDSIGKHELARMIALQILSRIFELYNELIQMNHFETSDKDFLLDKFKEYYSRADFGNSNMLRITYRKFKFKLFIINPNLAIKIFRS